MALSDNPRSAAFLALLLAALVGYAGYTGAGLELVGLPGVQSRQAEVAALKDTAAALEASIDSTKKEMERGSVEQIRARVEEYRGTLSVLRQFVPEKNKVPNRTRGGR